MTLGRRLTAEALGTGFLLAVIVGSGIMGERLAAGNLAITLLANSVATGFGLAVLIALFAPISGAHFNPLITVREMLARRMGRSAGVLYIVVQIFAAVAGVMVAHLMFGMPMLQLGTRARTGLSQWIGEVVATAGLFLAVGLGPRSPVTAGAVVGAYIAAAYWFTSSTAFANPAVTIARALTDTFAGIRPVDVSGFVAAQLLGAALGAGLVQWFTHSHRNAGDLLSR